MALDFIFDLINSLSGQDQQQQPQTIQEEIANIPFSNVARTAYQDKPGGFFYDAPKYAASFMQDIPGALGFSLEQATQPGRESIGALSNLIQAGFTEDPQRLAELGYIEPPKKASSPMPSMQAKGPQKNQITREQLRQAIETKQPIRMDANTEFAPDVASGKGESLLGDSQWAGRFNRQEPGTSAQYLRNLGYDIPSAVEDTRIRDIDSSMSELARTIPFLTNEKVKKSRLAEYQRLGDEKKLLLQQKDKKAERASKLAEEAMKQDVDVNKGLADYYKKQKEIGRIDLRTPEGVMDLANMKSILTSGRPMTTEELTSYLDTYADPYLKEDIQRSILEDLQKKEAKRNKRK